MSNQRVSEINNFYFLPKDTPGAKPLPGAALLHETGVSVEQLQTDLFQQTKRNTITTQKPVQKSPLPGAALVFETGAPVEQSQTDQIQQTTLNTITMQKPVQKMSFDECITEVQNPVQNPVQDPVQRPVQIVVRAPREISYQWSSGLFEWCGEFCNFGTCFVINCPCCALCCGCDDWWRVAVFAVLPCCCPCCTASEVAVYTNQQYSICWCCATCCFGPLFYALLRNSLREMHKIPGSFAEDLLYSVFCFVCVNYQMYSEIHYGRYKVTGF